MHFEVFIISSGSDNTSGELGTEGGSTDGVDVDQVDAGVEI